MTKPRIRWSATLQAWAVTWGPRSSLHETWPEALAYVTRVTCQSYTPTRRTP